MKKFYSLFPWFSLPLSLFFSLLFINGSDFAFIPMVLLALCSVYFLLNYKKYYMTGGDDDE